MNLTGLPRLPDIRHVPTLDGWRAISILIVALSHAGLGHIIPGNMGVSMFFFLSGYLIMTLTLKECQGPSGFHASRFYIRRAIRLYPPLLSALAVAYMLMWLGWVSGGLTWQGLLGQLFYFSNYQYLFFHSPQDVPTGTGILWSLAVEEHFYIVMPLVIVVLQRLQSMRWLGMLLVGLTLVAASWRVYLVTHGATPDRIYYATDTRFDSILFGALLAIFWNPITAPKVAPSARWPVIATLLGGAGLLTCMLWRDHFFRDTFRYSLIGLSLIPLFHCSIRFHSQWPFCWLDLPWVKKIGIWSYAIYLIHLVLLEAFKAVTPVVWLNHGLALVSAVLFAHVTERLIDEPTRKVRARFR